MTVEIDIDYLLKNHITANEYLTLHMILNSLDERLEKFKRIVGDSNYYSILTSLIGIEFLSVDPEGLSITENCMRTFKGKGYFEEFYLAFPTSVIRPGGKRESLRTARKQCERKYRGIAKRRDTHEYIMKCLDFEIKDRTREGSMQYMKKMPNWLSSEAWIEYGEKMEQSSVLDIINSNVYGTEVV